MKKILITGGAGFIGTNTAAYYLDKGDQVIILDNFSRKGSRDNIKYLKSKSQNIKIIEGDIKKNQEKLVDAVKNVNLIFHFAAQVAVTTSVIDPRNDFEINALGTFNLLEAVRKSGNNPIFLYSSTNKVYGGLDNLDVIEKDTRYEFKDLPFGVSENQCLDFHSPYGCSKGAADQYVRDYSRIYGLNTIVFRQSCIYGPRQFGIEDQGWIAWFIIALTNEKKITIYGNGKQVRDLLYVGDLIHAYDLAAENIKQTKGQVYNIGGGYKNTLSVWYELYPILEELFKRRIDVNFSDIRPGDQPIFVSDIRKANKDFAWEPKTNIKQGVRNLFDWVQQNKNIFTS